MANSFGLSKEHEQVYSLMRCPLCREYPIIPKYYKIDKTPILPKTPYPEMDRSAIAECPKCQQRWAVFSESQPGMVRQKTKIMTVQSNKPEKLTEKKQSTASGLRRGSESSPKGRCYANERDSLLPKADRIVEKNVGNDKGKGKSV